MQQCGDYHAGFMTKHRLIRHEHKITRVGEILLRSERDMAPILERFDVERMDAVLSENAVIMRAEGDDTAVQVLTQLLELPVPPYLRRRGVPIGCVVEQFHG